MEAGQIFMIILVLISSLKEDVLIDIAFRIQVVFDTFLEKKIENFLFHYIFV
jgi:hypothetical protein